MILKQKSLTFDVHCYVELVGNNWQAFSVEYGLAIQDNTLNDAKEKITNMLLEYLHDAIHGRDKDFKNQLLSRRSPLHFYMKYWWFWFLSNINLLGKNRDVFIARINVEV